MITGYDISAEGFVNTDRLENTLVHLINEKKDSERSPLSFIDTTLFVKTFLDDYDSYFKESIQKCYDKTYKQIMDQIIGGAQND